MTTRSLLLALGLASFGLSGCMMGSLGGGLKGSGKVISEDRYVDAFTGITLKGAGDIEAKIGPKTQVVIHADDNIVPIIVTRVEKGTLIIENKENISPTKFLVVIESPKLENVGVEGAGDVTVSGLSGGTFAASVAGAGDINLSGSVETATLSIEGAGDVSAFDLKSTSATASIRGAGDIKISASENLTATIEGAGSIRHRGNPKVVSKINGAGSVTKE